MEPPERELIKKGMSQLIHDTICSSAFLAVFESQQIICQSDIDTIRACVDSGQRTMEFYRIIQTRVNAFSVLLLALEKTHQTGVLHILQNVEGSGVTEEEAAPNEEEGSTEQPKSNITFGVVAPVPTFTGRKAELEKLHGKITRSVQNDVPVLLAQSTFICGRGGIGKTQLAKQYIAEKGPHFDNNCIWLNAESEKSLNDCLRRFSQSINISTTDSSGNQKTIQVLIKNIQQFFIGSKALFVFDNAKKAPWFTGYFPLSKDNPNVYVLVTSRTTKWNDGEEVFNLRGLSQDDGVELVKNIGNFEGERHDDVIALVKKLEGFPLVIHQAASYIVDQRVTEPYSIQDYLHKYEKAEHFLHSRKNSVNDSDCCDENSRTATFSSWKLATDKIAQLGERGSVTLLVLSILSFISPEKIERQLFFKIPVGALSSQIEFIVTKLFKQFTSTFITPAIIPPKCSEFIEESKIKSAVKLLIKYSLINGKDNQSNLSIHRLVQEITRKQLRRDGKDGYILEVILNLLPEAEGEFSLENLDHAMTAWKHAMWHKSLLETYSGQLSNLLRSLFKNGRLEEALIFGREAIDQIKASLGANHKEYFAIMSVMVSVYTRQGNFEEAMKLSKKICQKSNDHFGVDDPHTIKAQESLSGTLWRCGKYAEALKLDEYIYEQFKKLNGEDDGKTLKAKQNYAISLRSVGMLVKSLPIFKELVPKYKARFGMNDIQVLRIQQNLALVYFDMGHYTTALEIFQKVYNAMITSQLSIQAYDFFAMLSCNLGNALNKVGRLDDALEILKKTKAQTIIRLGKKHYAYFQLHRCIANILRQQGSPSEALVEHKKVHKAYQSLLGKLHVETLIAERDIAEDLSAMGKHTEAIALLKVITRNLAFQTQVAHVLIETEILLAGVLYKEGEELANALTILCNVKKNMVEIFGQNSPRLESVSKKIWRIQNDIREV